VYVKVRSQRGGKPKMRKRPTRSKGLEDDKKCNLNISCKAQLRKRGLGSVDVERLLRAGQGTYKCVSTGAD